MIGVVATTDPLIVVLVDLDFEIDEPSWAILTSLGILYFFRFLGY